jgi:hypothetical protein
MVPNDVRFQGKADIRRATELRGGFCCEESWSEWQDLNLRPPRPERGALPG